MSCLLRIPSSQRKTSGHVIRRTYPIPLESLLTYLQSNEFVADWQKVAKNRMKPAIRVRNRPNGAFLIFGASRVQKDSRRPRFRVIAQDGQLQIRQEATSQGLLLCIVVVGYLMCIVPGMMVHLQKMANDNYKSTVAAMLIRVLDAKFTNPESNSATKSTVPAVLGSSTPSTTPAAPNELELKLKQLKSLLDMGLVTPADFEQKKAELLTKF